MLKRILIVGLFTGAGQLFSILVLKLVSQKSNSGQLTQLAQMDSLYQFIFNIIALGLQSAAMRNIALSDEWQKEYSRVQSARLMLSLLLFPISLLAFSDPAYSIFALAPLLALSGDYALYALGRPVTGSIAACARIVIPYGCILLTVFIRPDFISYSYFVALILALLLNNLYIARQLKMPFFFKPKWRDIFLYLKNIPLGLVTLSLYFIGTGVLLVMPYFYPSGMVAVAFVGLKFYLIFKGVLRIIHQSFVKDMLRNDICLQVDQLSMIGGILFFGSALFFPDSFISLFFGKIYVSHRVFFLLLGVCALVYSFALSVTTRAMLEKKDKDYTIVSTIAAGLCLLSVILFSFLSENVLYISVSILIGELSFLIGMLLIMKQKELLPQRALFLGPNLFFLLIPFAFRYFGGDTTLLYITSFSILALLLLLAHRRKFLLIPTGNTL